MEFDVTSSILIFIIYFTGFFIKGLAGFGDPLITAPALSLFLDNLFITPNNLILSIPSNGYIVWKSRRTFSVRKVLPILAFVLLGVIPGSFLLKYAASRILKTCLGLLVLGIGVEMLTRNRAKPVPHSSVIMAIISFCSGITAGLYGINLFFVAYLERTVKGREAFRGNICFIFFFESIFRAAIYLVNGIFTVDILVFSAISLPGMMLGLFAGGRVDHHLSDKSLRYIVIFVFMLAGASILVKSLIFE